MTKSKKSKKKEDEALKLIADDPTEADTLEEDALTVGEPSVLPVEVVESEPEPPPVVVEKPAVALKVFLVIAGPKWDQLAGFKSYATQQKLGPRSVPEWREELQKFMNKPTK